MIVKRYLIFCLFSVFCGVSKGQSSLTSPTIDVLQHNPATPTSANLQKYLEYPVNMSNGLPQIEFPLYTISAGNIQLPIVLKYHAGGIQVNQMPSNVGIGWSMDAGGVVTKKVNGLDDFYSFQLSQPYISPDYSAYHPTFQTIQDAADCLLGNTPGYNLINLREFLGRIALGQIDGEADEYFYSTPQGSGKMFYNQRQAKFQTNQLNGWSVITNPPPQSIYGGWNILSTNGLEYAFGNVEVTKTTITPQNGSPGNYDLPSAWHLSQITDHVHNKNVNIYYDNVWNYYSTGESGFWEFQTNGYLSGQGISSTSRQAQEAFISQIVFPGGQVQFIPTTTPGSPLKEVRVLDAQNKVIKKIVFEYFYDHPIMANGQVDNSVNTLFLSSIQETNTNSNNVTITNPATVFTYKFDKHVPKRFSYAQDLWGYFNGKLANTNLIPNNVLVLNSLQLAGQGGDRSIDEQFTQAGIIKEIKYSTGGKAMFEFENNRDAWELTGGLRVKKISNYDPVTAKTLVTEYDYKNSSGVESGSRFFNPRMSYLYYRMANNGVTTNHIRVHSESLVPIVFPAGGSVAYTEVTKKEIGAQDELRTKYYFSIPQVIDGTTGEADGVPFNKVTFEDNKNLNYKTEIFKKNSNGTFTKIKQEENLNETLKDYSDYISNVQVAWGGYGIGTWTTWVGNDPYVQTGLNMDPMTNLYRLCRESSVAVSATSTIYDGANTLATQTFNEYDHNNSNIKVQKMTLSNGDQKIIKYKYASDYLYTDQNPSTWNNSIQSLIDRNQLTAPIEITTYVKKNGSQTLSLTGASLLYYVDGKVNKVYALTTQKPLNDFTESSNNAAGFYFDSRYSLEQEVTQKDVNNYPLSVATRKGKTSYIWDYTPQQVTTFCENAEFNDIASTSFETTGKGNFTFSGIPVTPAKALTGKKVYPLTGNNITRSISSSKIYKVSLWADNANVLVNGAAPTMSGTTVGVYRYYEYLISSATLATISGTGNIDELRLYPNTATMVTYTYDPLIGISSVCDVNNKISIYEYDVLNRLSIIRDQDNNILKKVCYNYAGQPIDCSSPTTPPACAGYAVTYNNIANAAGFTATYTSAGNSYSFPIPSSGSGSLGCVPFTGSRYTLTISKPGNMAIYEFGNGCAVVSGTSASMGTSLAFCTQVIINYGF